MPTIDLHQRLHQARKTLHDAGQSQVLHFWDRLIDVSQVKLLDQISSVDWKELAGLVDSHVKTKPQVEVPHHVQPAPWYPHIAPTELQKKYKEATDLGWQMIRQGRVAAFTVAGGQGSRLGWEAPKGTFPATPVRGTCLFECMAQYIRNMQKRTGATIPWYVMTSPANDAETRAFFAQHKFFELQTTQVMCFPQAMMPALDMASGQVLMEAHDSMALSPNGHGGSLKALWTSGALADMKRRGIEQISYTQVDNPLVRVLDPLFLGLHALDGCQMSSKMLPKRDAFEKLGNFCVIDGRITVIEYSDLPQELAVQTTPEGRLRFYAGSIAIHALRVDFVESLNQGLNISHESQVTSQEQKSVSLQSEIRNQKSEISFALPWHRAEKKVPFVERRTGQVVKPATPNAVKLETFVFDALPLCARSIIYETDRVDEFAPIKNADAPSGQPMASDSPASSKALQTERAARWLAARSVHIPRKSDGTVDAIIDLSQLTAIYADDLPGNLPRQISPGEKVIL